MGVKRGRSIITYEVPAEPGRLVSAEGPVDLEAASMVAPPQKTVVIVRLIDDVILRVDKWRVEPGQPLNHPVGAYGVGVLFGQKAPRIVAVYLGDGYHLFPDTYEALAMLPRAK